jgi:hypothetical protein
MTISERCWIKILVVALCASSAWSQEEQQTPPPSPDTMKADTRPLAGAESITLGSLIGERSYLRPGFLVGQSADSNAHFQFNGQSGFLTATVLAGHLTLEHLSKRNEFSGAYQGGGVLYENNSQLNSTFHLGALSDSIMFRRATLILSDRGGYLPGFYAGLGGVAFGGAFSLGGLGNMPGLNPSFLPTRGIISGAGGYFNTALAQLEYRPTARSTVTLAGSFQTLSSTQAGFVDSNATILQTGYDRGLTSRDTVSVFYSASLIRYSGIAESVDAHFIAFSYGRRVTGRLALQLYAGPEIYSVAVPGQSQTHTFAGGGGKLTYRWSRSYADVSYWRGLTAGSGVLTGAQTDYVSAGLNRQLSRAWSGGLTGNYNFNSGLSKPNSGTSASGVVTRQYQYWTGTANLTRTLGRLARLNFFYSFQTQNSNQAFTNASGTGQSVLRHLFGVTFNFDYRPVGI